MCFFLSVRGCLSRISWFLYSVCPCRKRRYHLVGNPEVRMGNCPTPLRRAVRQDNYEDLENLLIDAGDRAAFLINEDHAPDCILQSCSRTIGNAFYYTVFKGRTAMVELMLKYGADVYSTGYNEETVLHCAARSCNLDIVRMLVDHGCDPKATDDLGRVALHSAARSPFNTTHIVKYFLDEKMDRDAVNMREYSGRTPLHEAAQVGTLWTVQTLVEYGADVTARTNAGETPLDLAQQSRRSDIVAFLQQEEEKMSRLDGTNSA